MEGLANKRHNKRESTRRVEATRMVGKGRDGRFDQDTRKKIVWRMTLGGWRSDWMKMEEEEKLDGRGRNKKARGGR